MGSGSGEQPARLRSLADQPGCDLAAARAGVACRAVVDDDRLTAELFLPTWVLGEWERRDRSASVADQVRLLAGLRGRYGDHEAIAADVAALRGVARWVEGTGDLFRLDGNDPAFGLAAGDLLECAPYPGDPEKLEVVRRVRDGFDPSCTVYRSQVTLAVRA